MRYYLADVEVKYYEKYQYLIGKKTKANILIAYTCKSEESRLKRERQIIYYIQELKKGNINSLMIDSGTYSQRDKEVDKEYEKEYGKELVYTDEDEKAFNLQHFHNYMEFLKKHGKDVSYFFTWDRDFERSDEAVANNLKWLKELEEQKELKEHGLRPVPVIHHPDYYGKEGDPNGIEPQYYIDEKYPVIAYGSASDTKEVPTHSVTDWVQIMINNSGLKCHQLGCASVNQLERLPIHSSDSTTWKQDVFRARKVRFKVNNDDNNVLIVPVDKRDIDVRSLKSFNSKSTALRTAFEKYLRDTIKIEPEEFFVNEAYDDQKTIDAKKINQHVVSMFYYINVFPRHVEQRHRINGWDTRWPEEKSEDDLKE